MSLPDLAVLRATFKAQSKPWPDYMTAISVITIIISVLANAWVVIRGLMKAPIRESAFHVILISQCINNVLQSGVVFSGMVNSKTTGMGEEESGKWICTIGMTAHTWLMSVGLCTHWVLAMNRAFACHPEWRLSVIACTKKATVGLLALIWFVCLLPPMIAAISENESFNGMFTCMIVDDYVENLLAGKTVLRPVEPSISITGDAVTSFIGIAIIVSAFSYVVIIQGLSKLGAKQENLGSTSMVVPLLFAEYMAFWVPHIVGVFYNQDLLKNHAYVYLPMLGTALAPFLYIVTMAEYRPPFLAKLGGGTSVTPLKESA